MDDEIDERHLNIHFTPEIMAGVYANFANVSHSDYEFTLTFAKVDHEVDDDEVPGGSCRASTSRRASCASCSTRWRTTTPSGRRARRIRELPETEWQHADDEDEAEEP